MKEKVILKDYMKKVSYPEVVMKAMVSGKTWDGELEDYGIKVLANEQYRRIPMDDEQKADVKKYIDAVNVLIFQDADAIVNAWMQSASELEGTTKQIAWAADIRSGILRRVAIDSFRDISDPVSLYYHINQMITTIRLSIQDNEDAIEMGIKSLGEAEAALLKKIEDALTQKFPLGNRRTFKAYAKETSQEEASAEKKKECIKLYEDTLPLLATISDAKTWIDSRDNVGYLIAIAFIKSLIPEDFSMGLLKKIDLL